MVGLEVVVKRSAVLWRCLKKKKKKQYECSPFTIPLSLMLYFLICFYWINCSSLCTILLLWLYYNNYWNYLWELCCPTGKWLFHTLSLYVFCTFFFTPTDHKQMSIPLLVKDLLWVSSQKGIFPSHCQHLVSLGCQLLFLWLFKVLGDTFDCDLIRLNYASFPNEGLINKFYSLSQFLPRWRCRNASDALLQRSMASSGSTSPFSFISFPIQLPVRKVKSGKLWCTVPLTQDRTLGSVGLWLEEHFKKAVNQWWRRRGLPNSDHLPLGGTRVQLPHAADVPRPLELLRVDEEDGLLDLSKDLILQREHPGIQRHSTSRWDLIKKNKTTKNHITFLNLGFSLQVEN